MHACSTVMVPLLFLLYNDLPSMTITPPALLFADDVKILYYCPIVNQQSSTQLQQDFLLLAIKGMI